MSQKAAIRRRRQAVKNFMHLGPLVRPKYKKVSASKSARRLQQRIVTEHRIRQGKKK